MPRKALDVPDSVVSFGLGLNVEYGRKALCLHLEPRKVPRAKAADTRVRRCGIIRVVANVKAVFWLDRTHTRYGEVRGGPVASSPRGDDNVASEITILRTARGRILSIYTNSPPGVRVVEGGPDPEQCPSTTASGPPGGMTTNDNGLWGRTIANLAQGFGADAASRCCALCKPLLDDGRATGPRSPARRKPETSPFTVTPTAARSTALCPGPER